MTQPPNQPYGPQGGQQYPQGQGNQQQPYGQQYPQQPYGGQQYPQQPGQPYPQQPPPYPPQAAPKKGMGPVQISILVACVLVIAVGGYFLYQHFAGSPGTQGSATPTPTTRSSSADPTEQSPSPSKSSSAPATKDYPELAVGKCVTVSGDQVSASHESVECSDTSIFSWEVGQQVSDSSECPDDTLWYWITQPDGSKLTTCLVPNMAEGVCYAEQDDNVEPFVVDPSCAAGTVKVTARIDEANATCTTGQEMYTYEKPARTYCGALN
ncbi:MAG: hypothetical protein Q4D79_01915 [Propionibacteriaceae bacterium]|nr:hypothetical protein [Propionibacteriaceae bacterium]